LIECKTYRIRGHSRSDRNLYRTKEEIESWRKRDPIELLEAELEALGLASREQIEAIRAQVEVEIRKGVAFAEASPVPSAEDLLRDVYTT
jgi:pyruvate dehydrogenase E1 component alpha subunit